MTPNGRYHCALSAEVNPLEVRCEEVSYVPSISVVEPSAVCGYDVDCITYGLSSLSAGGIGLLMNFRILPLDVSFQCISIEEIPCGIGVSSGYFANSYFNNAHYHSTANGAGVWSGVDQNNVTLARDCAALSQSLPRMTADGQITNDLTVGWCAGENIWSIPFGWNEAGVGQGTEHFKGFAADTTQVFTIDSNGTTTVRKLGHSATRELFGHVYLDGGIRW